MTTLEIILELMKFVLPAVLVLVTCIYVMRESHKKLETEHRYELLQKSLSQVIPLRLQAYERALLFLERISPENMMIRIEGRSSDAKIFHSLLLIEVRREFEHNVAQQLYINSDSWAVLVAAKEQILNLINYNAKKLAPTAKGVELAKLVLHQMAESGSSPSQKAIQVLKQDIQKMFKA